MSLITKRKGNALPTSRRDLSRAGLTLMELVVVLAILAAVAGILIPMFPNLLRRAHKASDATQSSEISKAVQLHQAMFISYPDHFDSMIDTTTSDFPTYIPNDGGPTHEFGGFVNSEVLGADEAAALHRVGIDHVEDFATTTDKPTMDPYANAAASATQLTGTEHLAFLDTTAALANQTLKAAIEADPTARFVVFGVGPRCTMVGSTIQDAPMSVPQNKELTPAKFYCRVGVVFKVAGAEVSRTERARFICACAMEDDELESTEKDIVGYYEVAQGAE